MRSDSRPRVVVTDADYPDLNIERGILEAEGIIVDVPQVKSGPRLIDATRDADGLIVQYARITREVIAALRHCRIIVPPIDLDAAADHGIAVHNVPDYCPEEVADHTLALMLAVLRGVHSLASAVESGQWSLEPVRPLRRIRGLRLGLIGCGRIGSAVAARGVALGMRVLAYNPLLDDATPIAEPTVIADQPAIAQSVDDGGELCCREVVDASEILRGHAHVEGEEDVSLEAADTLDHQGSDVAVATVLP